jgi:hypothetical protein
VHEETLPRGEILRRLDAEYSRLKASLARLTPAQALEPNIVGTWSVKDVIAHLIHWNRFPVGEVRAALDGDTFIYDERGEDQINASTVARYGRRSLDEVVADFDASYQGVVDFIRSLPDCAFEPGNPLEVVLDETIHGTFANNTYEHYPIHEAQIREYADRITR